MDWKLEIEFKDSRSASQYWDVPHFVYLELMEEDSKGRYFLNHIRGANHYWRVK